MELDNLPQVEEVFQDFEVIEDPEALPEVLPVEEDLPELLPVEETETSDPLEDVPLLQEVEEPCWLRESSLLGLRRLHIRAREPLSGEEPARPDEAGHALIDPLTERRLGHAFEVRESSRTLAIYVEIREGNHLRATIRRPPRSRDAQGRAFLEMRDVDGRLLGVFEEGFWARVSNTTLPIQSPAGKDLLLLHPYFLQGRMEFLLPGGGLVGGMTAKERPAGKFRFVLVPGCSWNLYFTEALDDRPEDKLRLLAAVIGIFLFDRERGG